MCVYVRTVPLQRRLVIEVVSHDGRGVVQDVRYLIVVLAVGDDLLQQVDVIPAAGLDELLLYGGSLYKPKLMSIVTLFNPFKLYWDGYTQGGRGKERTSCS